MNIVSEDINSTFIQSLLYLHENGKDLLIRGSEVREVVDFSFCITNPKRRVLTCPFRYNNVAATIAETFWVFAGRNDLEFLINFLPNAIDYSDNDGLTWGAGYGNRLRHFHPLHNRWDLHNGNVEVKDGYFYENTYGIGYYDQIDSVIKTLQEDKFSRQAIIVLPQPNIDYDPHIQTEDRPCTVFIQFLIRDDKLYCFVRMRSTDIIYGCFNINVFEWTLLQEIIAGILNIEIGEYHHNAVSFHYYHSMDRRIDKILSSHKAKGYNVYEDQEIEDQLPIKFNNIHTFDKSINKCMDGCIDTLKNPHHNLIYQDDDTVGDLRDYLMLPISYNMVKNGLFSTAIYVLENMESLDLKVAGLEYIFRITKKLDPEYNLELKTSLITMLLTRPAFKELNSKTINFILGDWPLP